jgi:hypothetical protein
LTEAKKKIVIKPDKDATDYNEDLDTGDDNTDYTEDESDETPTDATDDDTDPNVDTDKSDTSNEDTDYTDENTDEGDDTGGDETTDDTEEGGDSTNTDDIKKNSLLIKDFVALYKLVDSINDRLGDVKKSDILTSSIIIQVMKNFSTMGEQVFDFIQGNFTKNSYVNNLFQYNLFIEAIKINMEMLKKIKNLNMV